MRERAPFARALGATAGQASNLESLGEAQRCPMTAADRIIRWTTALAVVGVATVAAVASYEHAYALVRAHGETGWTGRLVPLTLDGMIYASSMVMLDSARRKTPVPALARW